MTIAPIRRDNGAGKTTLLKLVVGSLSSTRGTVHVHRNLKFGYFSQHHVDQLDLKVCPVELLQNRFPGTFLFLIIVPKSASRCDDLKVMKRCFAFTHLELIGKKWHFQANQ